MIKSSMKERLVALMMEKGFGLEDATICADHLLANGVLAPPFKIDDYVWNISSNGASPSQIRSIELARGENHELRLFFECCDCSCFELLDIGRTVFTSESAAELALTEPSIPSMTRQMAARYIQSYLDSCEAQLGSSYFAEALELAVLYLKEQTDGLIVLPFNIDDWAYLIKDGEIYECRIYGIELGDNARGERNACFMCTDDIFFELADVGKTVFTTEAAAQAALSQGGEA